MDLAASNIAYGEESCVFHVLILSTVEDKSARKCESLLVVGRRLGEKSESFVKVGGRESIAEITNAVDHIASASNGFASTRGKRHVENNSHLFLLSYGIFDDSAEHPTTHKTDSSTEFYSDQFTKPINLQAASCRGWQ